MSESNKYRCGLQVGDRVKLIKLLRIRTHSGRYTGDEHKVGEIWTILEKSEQDPGIVWMRQPDGELHTWDDDETVWDYFEQLS